MAFWIRGIELLLYGAFLVSILLFGAGFAGGYTLLEALLLVAGSGLILYHGWAGWPATKRAGVYGFLLLALWFAFLCFQLIPLPLALIERISPKLPDLFRQFSPGGLADLKQMPLSLGTYHMRTEVARAAAYGAAFFIAYWLIQDRPQLRRFATAVMVIGFTVSMVGLVCHRLAPEKLYGFLEFKQSAPITPYLNKNHFANLLVMTFPVTLGFMFLEIARSSFVREPSWRGKILWFASKETTRVYLAGGALAVQLAGILTSASRGGLLGLAAAAASFVFLWGLGSRKKWFGMALLATVVVIAAILGAYQAKPLMAKLRMMKNAPTEDLAIRFRLSNWRDSLRMFRDFPVTGIGAGGFQELFPLYKSIPERAVYSQVRFYHAENELLEGLVETGVVGSLLLAVFSVSLAASFTRRRSSKEEGSKTVEWLSLGLASGAAGMTAHSFVDFSMHVPANMALLAALGGVLARLSWGGPLLSERAVSGGPLPQRPGRLIVSLGIVAVAAFLAGPFLWRQWRSDYYYTQARNVMNHMTEQGEVSRPLVVSAYQDLLRMQPDAGGQARFHFSIGKVYVYFGLLSKGQGSRRETWFQQAEQSLKRAVELEPLNAMHQYALGWLYEEWGRSSQAARYLRNAARLAPKNAFYHFKLGENQTRLGEQASARAAFKETVGINQEYLIPVLKVLVSAHSVSGPEDLSGLLPHGKPRKELEEQAANFFRGLAFRGEYADPAV